MSSELKPLRMNAYYYAFDATGEPSVDLILSAVACAGKAFHHTDCWTDESPPYEDRHRGSCPVDWIQNAANDAAREAANRRTPSPAVMALVEAVRGIRRCNSAEAHWLLDEALAGVEREIGEQS